MTQSATQSRPQVKHLTSQLFLPDRVKPIDVHRWTQPEPNPVHDHDFMEIAVILRGTGRHEAAAESTDFERGDVFVIRPGVWHRYVPDGAERGVLTTYNLLFDIRSLRREMSWLYDEPAAGYLLTAGASLQGEPRVLKVKTGADAHHIESMLDELAHLLHDEPEGDSGATSTMIAAVGRLLLFIAEIARHLDPKQLESVRRSATVHPAVQHAVRLLEEEPRRAWTLADLGKAVHLDPSYLVKLFSRTVGTPPIMYLNQVRCERAAALLRHTAMHASEISDAVGFCDPNYFSRRFRAHYGDSPTSFRKQQSS